MTIRSIENEKVKHYLKLQQKKYRDKYQEFLVEGSHLVLEAYRHGYLKELIIEEDQVFPVEVEQVEVTSAIIKKISQVPSPQKVMGLCQKITPATLGDRILILDGLQDPGNVGTIIRSAVAFGIDTIILGENTVDLYNPKVIRSTQGMLFQVPVMTANIDTIIPKLKEKNIKLFATRVEYGKPLSILTKEDKKHFALIVGNEGNGVEQKYLEQSDENLYIPMQANVESLNVACATSIILYEMRLEDEN